MYFIMTVNKLKMFFKYYLNVFNNNLTFQKDEVIIKFILSCNIKFFINKDIVLAYLFNLFLNIETNFYILMVLILRILLS